TRVAGHRTVTAPADCHRTVTAPGRRRTGIERSGTRSPADWQRTVTAPDAARLRRHELRPRRGGHSPAPAPRARRDHARGAPARVELWRGLETEFAAGRPVPGAWSRARRHSDDRHWQPAGLGVDPGRMLSHRGCRAALQRAAPRKGPTLALPVGKAEANRRRRTQCRRAHGGAAWLRGP